MKAKKNAQEWIYSFLFGDQVVEDQTDVPLCDLFLQKNKTKLKMLLQWAKNRGSEERVKSFGAAAV